MNYIWAAVAAAGVMVFTALATAYAQSRIGTSISAALAEKPELGAQAVIMIAIPETMVILGFVIAVLIILRAGTVG